MKCWVAAMMAVIATDATAQSVIDGSAENLTDPLVKKGLSIIAAEMRDPLSTQFRGLKFGSRKTVLCGQVNGKNGFGGYVGFVPFMHALGSSSAIIINERGTDRIDTTFRNLKIKWLRQDGCLP